MAIVAGCLLALPAFGMLAGGVAALVAQAVATDDDGYFTYDLERVDSDGVAVAATDLWLDPDTVDGGDDTWLLDWLDVDLRLRVDGAGPTEEVFVGIARARDVEDYLGDAAYSDVVELDNRTARYLEVEGAGDVAAPTEQDFWAATASGTGEQELEWEARGGRWSVVVMNSDGAAGVSADVQVGARSGAITPIGITLIVLGVITAAGAVVLIVIGVRGRGGPDASNRPTTTPPPADHTADTPASVDTVADTPASTDTAADTPASADTAADTPATGTPSSFAPPATDEQDRSGSTRHDP